MSAGPRPSGEGAAQNELLARLGLPPSASPEDVDQLHLAVSQYLAAAPSGLKTWAHAQAAALDEAYLLLTDPVGFGGSALRGPTRPPTVVPGGPATPPARRGPVPADPALEPAVALATGVAADAGSEVADATDDEDLDALYASVTPSAHREMGPEVLTAAERNRRKRAAEAQAQARAGLAAPVMAPKASEGPWKPVALVLMAVVGVAALLFVGYTVGGGGALPGVTSGPAAQASASTPVVDQAKVAALMVKLQANPKDAATLLALGDEYYAGQDFTQAASFYDQLLAIDPKNIQGLLARGAVYWNSGDLANAEKSWKAVVAVEPNNQEAHYDLGFLYLNQPTPDWAGVQREWNEVIRIDPASQLAQTVQSHLDSLVKNSMIPAPSGSAGASAAPSGSPAASPAASPSASAVP